MAFNMCVSADAQQQHMLFEPTRLPREISEDWNAFFNEWRTLDDMPGYKLGVEWSRYGPPSPGAELIGQKELGALSGQWPSLQCFSHNPEGLSPSTSLERLTASSETPHSSIYPSPNTDFSSSDSLASNSRKASISSSNTMARDISTPPNPPGQFRCTHCVKSFEKRHFLNRHELQHSKPIACPVPGCTQHTAKTRDMNRHLVAQHPNHKLAQSLLARPRYMCADAKCATEQVGFRRKDNLMRHVRNYHTGKVP